MNCPNCGMQMKKTYCLHCGYMTNGNFIDTKKLMEDSLLELYFGKQYDKVIRNQNWFLSGLLGPTYLFCQNFWLIGFLLIILDSIVSLFFLSFNHALLFYYMVMLLNGIYWVVNRLVWATIGNMLYIKLLSKRLLKFKEKYKEDYKERIQELYKKDSRYLKIKYIVFGLIFLILFLFIKGIWYNYLHLS